MDVSQLLWDSRGGREVAGSMAELYTPPPLPGGFLGLPDPHPGMPGLLTIPRISDEIWEFSYWKQDS
jgi:hypothetical protein